VLFGPAGCMQKNAGNWKQPNRESRVTTASEVYATWNRINGNTMSRVTKGWCPKRFIEFSISSISKKG